MSKKTKSTKATKATKRGAKQQGDPDLVPLKDAMKQPAAKKGARTKAAKAAKEKKLSALDAAAQVLKDAGEPMTCKAMIDAMSAKKLWTSDAPTPAATLYSAILREQQRKGAAARFTKVDRGQFALNTK